MTISINWATGVILVPQADLTPISGTLYELNLNTFRLILKDLEDSEDGSVWPTTHNHNTSITLSGVTYVRSVEIINGYTVEFEDGQYTVSCVGANHNLADVKVANQVSLIIGNSAGLVEGNGGGASYTPAQIADAVRAELATELARLDVFVSSRASQSSIDIVADILTAMDLKLDSAITKLDVIEVTLDQMFLLMDLVRKYQYNRSYINVSNKSLTIFDDDNITPIKTFILKDSTGTPSIQEVTERLPI